MPQLSPLPSLLKGTCEHHSSCPKLTPLQEECPESRGALLYLCVYSLLPENFRTCLMRTCVQYIPMSISITPHNQVSLGSFPLSLVSFPNTSSNHY